jgi:DNA polymerase III subunit beta
MKIRCDREAMLSAFQIAASVAATRSPKPILQNVKLEVTPTQATLMATDQETAIRIQLEDLEVIGAGNVILPVDRFGPILRESSDTHLTIESTDIGTRVHGERSLFQLPSGNPDEFPSISDFFEEKYHEISARLFRELIRRTVFATDVESSRYALGGVLLEFEEDKLVAVGTDGRRLAKMEGEAQSVGGHHGSETVTIVPSKAMHLLERALADEQGSVLLAARNNDILVKTPRLLISSRLVEGRFPRWRDVFPKREGSIRIELTVGPTYAAVRQASVVNNKESRGVELLFGDGMLVMAAATAEVGESRVEFPLAYAGDPLKVTLDHRYVSEFLRVLDPQAIVTLEVQGSESAALFTTDDGYGYVVMPMSTEN